MFASTFYYVMRQLYIFLNDKDPDVGCYVPVKVVSLVTIWCVP